MPRDSELPTLNLDQCNDPTCEFLEAGIEFWLEYSTVIFTDEFRVSAYETLAVSQYFVNSQAALSQLI